MKPIFNYWYDRIRGQHDFGDGKPRPSYVHSRGGGWIDKVSTVHANALVDRGSMVYGQRTTVGANTRLTSTMVYGGARVGEYCNLSGIALGPGTVLQDGVSLRATQDVNIRSVKAGAGFSGFLQGWKSYASCEIKGACILRGTIQVNVPVVVDESTSDAKPVEITNTEFGCFFAHGATIFIRKAAGAVLSGCKISSGITLEGELKMIDCTVLPGSTVVAEPGSGWIRGYTFTSYGRHLVKANGTIATDALAPQEARQ